MKVELYLKPYANINYRWIKNLNVSSKSFKLLDKNMDDDIGKTYTKFLKASQKKGKRDKLNNIKTKLSFSSKHLIEMKIKCTTQRKIHVMNKLMNY